MTSIFQQALGSDFDRLHPQLQRRFGVGLDSGEACIGRGTMTSIRRGPWWTVPFLQIGRLRNILIPDTGTDMPFTVENYPYRDPLGRLHEYCDDAAGCFAVDLEVHNQRWGFLFGYRGTFRCEWAPATDAPARLKPRRHEPRA